MSKANRQAASPRNGAHGLPRSQADAHDYAQALESDYGFEAECVRARFNYLLRQLRRIKPKRILEIGCGVDLFIDTVAVSDIGFERWVVVEPAVIFAAKARARASTEPRLHVVEGYFQDPAVRKALREQGQFDVLLLSGLLQDLDDPAQLLREALAAAAPGAHVLVTTPNAMSFHRLLAVEMGLMPAPHSLSTRNVRFRQSIVFDPKSLRSLLEEGGLRDLQFEGYMFKPFTHGQMAQVLALLPPEASEGLDRLGQKFPEHGAEIAYVGVKG
jgi:2-polyprenyl-3-methyl-5-hydroxy-6-metoxy-1,4-benzoquinol methylase